ncbi:MAG TPA: MaoC family dehydratase [Brevibacterium sp.]|jgi:acyl dehydratase|nr:MaoC family dehydratase [Brevibacterium sp.]
MTEPGSKENHVRTINGIDEFESLIGQELGSSEWLTMDQDAINAFADVTGDHQWIHVDEERAAEGPYGATIVHGFFTLALIPKFSSEVFTIEGVAIRVNYGLNKVRFLQPVVVGSRLRGKVEVKDVIRGEKGTQVILKQTIEIDGQERPACIAEVVTLLVE